MVEMFNPSTGASCPLGNIQLPRTKHTSCSGLICGGENLDIDEFGSPSMMSCEKITGADISPLPSLRLRQARTDHLCWSLPGEDKILLLGGGGPGGGTSEIVTGSASYDSFALPYHTK